MPNKKNYVLTTCIQCEDDVEAIQAAKSVAIALLQEVHNNTIYVEVGHPGTPRFDVFSDGLVSCRRIKK